MALSAENKNTLRELIADINASPARMKQIAAMSDEEATDLIARWKGNKALELQRQKLFNDDVPTMHIPNIFGRDR